MNLNGFFSGFVTPSPKLPISTADPNETLIPSLLDNPPVHGLIDSSKPLIPSRVAPQIPSATPLPPVPSRPVPKPETMLTSIVKESSISVPNTQTEISPEVSLAVERRKEMKAAALQAKQSGDQTAALQYVRLVKVFLFLRYKLNLIIN